MTNKVATVPAIRRTPLTHHAMRPLALPLLEIGLLLASAGAGVIAFKELSSDLIFEAAHSSTNGRLLYVQHSRGTAKATVFG